MKAVFSLIYVAFYVLLSPQIMGFFYFQLMAAAKAKSSGDLKEFLPSVLCLPLSLQSRSPERQLMKARGADAPRRRVSLGFSSAWLLGAKLGRPRV